MPDALPQAYQPSSMKLWYEAQDFRAVSKFNGFEQRAYQWGQWRAILRYEGWERAEADELIAFIESKRTDLPLTFYDPSHRTPRGAAVNGQGLVKNDVVTGAGTSNDIRFTAATKTIQKSGNGLDVFSAGQRIKITGAAQAGNNKTVTALTVAPSLITVAETLVDEASSAATLNGYQTGTSLKTDGWPNNTVIFKAGDLFGLGTRGSVHRITGTITSNGSGLATLTFAQPIAAAMSPEDNDTIIATDVPFTMVVERMIVPDVSPPVIFDFEIELKEYRGG